MILETPRLCLRPLRDSDADALARHLNDWAVAEWLVAPPYPYQPADAAWWIGQVRADHEGGRPTNFAIALRETDELIGNIGCAMPGEAPHEVGYWLARPHWGRGLMSEALAAVLDHAFGALGATRLVAYADPANIGSRRVLSKAGFDETGQETRGSPSKNGGRDRIAFALDRAAARQ